MGFTVKRVLRRVLRRGSEKGVSRRCLERPLVEYAPLGVRPIEFFMLERLTFHAFRERSQERHRHINLRQILGTPAGCP